MTNDAPHEPFAEFHEFPKVGNSARRARENVVKASHIVNRGAQELHTVENDPGQPDIVVHREGNKVISLDFQCKCGCSAAVRFEYDEE